MRPSALLAAAACCAVLRHSAAQCAAAGFSGNGASADAALKMGRAPGKGAWFLQKTGADPMAEPIGYIAGFWKMSAMCETLFDLVARSPGTVCGHTLATRVESVRALGGAGAVAYYGTHATVDCGGPTYRAVDGSVLPYPVSTLGAPPRSAATQLSPQFVVMQVCSTVCMMDPSKRCCTLPRQFAGLFQCCREECCCPDQDASTCTPASARRLDDPVACVSAIDGKSAVKNGVCEEHRYCPTGTDCTDCGTCVGQKPADICFAAKNGKCGAKLGMQNPATGKQDLDACGDPHMTDCTDCGTCDTGAKYTCKCISPSAPCMSKRTKKCHRKYASGKCASFATECKKVISTPITTTTAPPTAALATTAPPTTSPITAGSGQSTTCSVGDAVSAKWGTDGYYDATIAAINKDNTITVNWGDGDTTHRHPASSNVKKGGTPCTKGSRRRAQPRTTATRLRHSQGVAVTATIEENSASSSIYARLMSCLKKQHASSCNTTGGLSGS